jgi:hypothetical protein
MTENSRDYLNVFLETILTPRTIRNVKTSLYKSLFINYIYLIKKELDTVSSNNSDDQVNTNTNQNRDIDTHLIHDY